MPASAGTFITVERQLDSLSIEASAALDRRIVETGAPPNGDTPYVVDLALFMAGYDLAAVLDALADNPEARASFLLAMQDLARALDSGAADLRSAILVDMTAGWYAENGITTTWQPQASDPDPAKRQEAARQIAGLDQKARAMLDSDLFAPFTRAAHRLASAAGVDFLNVYGVIALAIVFASNPDLRRWLERGVSAA